MVLFVRPIYLHTFAKRENGILQVAKQTIVEGDMCIIVNKKHFTTIIYFISVVVYSLKVWILYNDLYNMTYVVSISAGMCYTSHIIST